MKERFNENIRQALPYGLHGRQDHETGSHKWHHNPDVQAAERREHDPGHQGQRHGEQQAEQLVEHVLAELEERVAADPHLVEGVGQLGLGDHVLEAQLQVGVEPVGVPVLLVLRVLLRLGQRGAARREVVVVHEDAGVRLLRLQPHGAAARPGPALPCPAPAAAAPAE